MKETGRYDLQEKKLCGNVGVKDTRKRLESKYICSKQFMSTLSSFRVSTFITTQFFHQLFNSNPSFILLYKISFLWSSEFIFKCSYRIVIIFLNLLWTSSILIISNILLNFILDFKIIEKTPKIKKLLILYPLDNLNIVYLFNYH